MTTYKEGLQIILSNISEIATEMVSLENSAGRVVACDIFSPINLPLWDNSAMDGFAARTSDCKIDTKIQVKGALYAGESTDSPLEPGTAMRIMTGAPVPEGTDAIIPWEDCDDDGSQIVVRNTVKIGQHIRIAGEDIKAGEQILGKGALMTPQNICIVAACGKPIVNVYRKPRVALLSTGDELLNPGEPLSKGKIYNSSSASLSSAIKIAGGEPVIIGTARDTLEYTSTLLKSGLNCDILLTTAGVSAGSKDFVREALKQIGAKEHFWKVKIKPGHPLSFSTVGKTSIFSLPGNPVSSLITFEMFVKPAILKMRGIANHIQPLKKAILVEDVKKKGDRLHFFRVTLSTGADGRIYAKSAGDQNTGISSTLSKADGLAFLPENMNFFSEGSEIEVHILNNFVY